MRHTGSVSFYGHGGSDERPVRCEALVTAMASEASALALVSLGGTLDHGTLYEIEVTIRAVPVEPWDGSGDIPDHLDLERPPGLSD